MTIQAERSITTPVERVILRMWECYSEVLPLSEMASTAILSPFHFSRVFRDTTGVSPGRFLSAIRIYEAKRLLLTTPLSVTDISFEVGYNSLGTFTRRFTQSVGISPAKFRRMPERGMSRLPRPQDRERPARAGSVFGAVHMPDTGVATEVFMGVFTGPIAQGRPPSCQVLHGAGYSLSAVPEGEWYVHAVALESGAGREPAEQWTRKPLFVGVTGPLMVHADSFVQADIVMRPKRLTDMPILLALPVLDAKREVSRETIDTRAIAVPPQRLIACHR
jgi:AraC family transcriptional regulator